MKKADKLFSEHIREKYQKCQHCGRTEALQTAHIISRECRKLRYDERNVFCLCAGCHFYFHKHPLHYADWVRQVKGVATYKTLIRESNQLKPVGIQFYEKVIHTLTP